MTPECYLTFIMDATITGIEKVVKDEIATSIEKALKTKIHLPPTLTIYETELRKNRRIIRGLYNPNTNELILNKGHWCRKTLIHETLHAASYFSQEEYERLNEKIRILIEGMTEFLQGYIMYKEYPECYKAWVNQKYPICSLPITYEPATQAFAALARHVPIREITKLYIWQPNTNWYAQYKKIPKQIQHRRRNTNQKSKNKNKHHLHLHKRPHKNLRQRNQRTNLPSTNKNMPKLLRNERIISLT